MFFKFNRRPSLRAGLYISQDAIQSVVIDDKEHCLSSETLSYGNHESPQQIINRLVAVQPLLKNAVLNLIFYHSYYTVKQIDKPEGIHDSDLLFLLAEKALEIISEPITDAIIDYYELPAGRRDAIGKVSMAVGSKKLMAPWTKACHHHHLPIESITTEDVALRNSALHALKDARDCVACLSIREFDSHLLIVKEGVIYVTRSIRMGYLSDVSLLFLELQRTFDYFDGVYNDSSVSVIAIFSDKALPVSFLDLIKNSFTAVILTEISEDKGYASHLAIGAALNYAKD